MTKSSQAAAILFKPKMVVECHRILNRHWKEIAEVERSYERPADLHWAKKVVDDGTASALVAEIEDRVVGWCLWKIEKNSIKLMRIVVRASCQRRGVGRQMIDELKRKLDSNVRVIEALVRETNWDAVMFFSSKEEHGGVGFRGVGVQPLSSEAYEDETNLDDWKFEYAL